MFSEKRFSPRNTPALSKGFFCNLKIGLNVKTVRIILAIISPFLLAACSSCLKRQECEKVNWYQYGHDLAMQGTRPGMDTLVQECRQVNADVKEADLDRGFKEGMNQYCLPETVFQTGKSGLSFKTEFCDPGKLSFLNQQYRKGINEYCLPDSGYQVGASGKPYTKVCNADQEKAFMPQYRKGRKKYLEVMVVETERKLVETDQEQRQVERELSLKASQLAMLPAARTIVQKEYNAATKSWQEVSHTEDPYQYERSRFKGEVDSHNSRLNQLGATKKKMSEDLSSYRRELVQVSD